jgi:pimeloyl-ACP methyl ester carboxylesterase
MVAAGLPTFSGSARMILLRAAPTGSSASAAAWLPSSTAMTRPSASVAAIPVPEGVTRAVIRLADERRYDVPVVLICPEFTPAQARQWIDQGEVPELAKSKNLSFLDIDSGHWPMISAPADLARLLSQAAEES